MPITDETITSLRAAATAGAPNAARELGRLLSMLRTDSLEDARNSDFLATWPEEPWLRTALHARPDDHLAALLLAGRLVQQIAFWQIDTDHAAEHGENDQTLARRRAEAQALYTRVLQADPTNPTALAGTAALNTRADTTTAPERFSYYELNLETGSGSFTHSERVITTDPDEVRWACSWLMAPVVAEVEEPPYGVDLHLFTYMNGSCDTTIDLGQHFTTDGTLNWTTAKIPPLTGELLPAGHPVDAGHYGYSCDWG
ncbi:hypothetical protein SAMN05444920_12110 [Nonomuraea solani]|uniref:Uncharacterized protein n=1 Tax=Nonomuraea solani TaxID=1144553 RepID=A0A1H6EUS4_9ACTN|nr:hypothetical protein [Nonomuraea solani]SEH01562.1 hypothetical protein SAMN05444920_12110 [Nonomuraea solani]